MSSLTSSQIDPIDPYASFIEPYRQLYSEGLFHLSVITDLYLEQKKMSTKTNEELHQRSCEYFRRILGVCVEAKKSYYESGLCGTIGKTFDNFLEKIGIETSLSKARKALYNHPSGMENSKRGSESGNEISSSSHKPVNLSGPLKNFTDDSVERSAQQVVLGQHSADSRSSRGSGEKESQKSLVDFDFEVQKMLARYYALVKNEQFVFQITDTNDGLTKTITVKPNGQAVTSLFQWATDLGQGYNTDTDSTSA